MNTVGGSKPPQAVYENFNAIDKLKIREHAMAFVKQIASKSFKLVRKCRHEKSGLLS